MLENIISATNDFLWESLLVNLLVAAGLFFTLVTGFVQIRLFKRAWKVLLFKSRSNRKGEEGAITPFQAFSTSMAVRVGSGNIAGVAVAISLGGPGAVFWMWIIALLGMASSVIEVALGQIYKIRLPDGTYRGGPAYYLKFGLGRPELGAIFAVLVIFTYGFAFTGIQANTIADSMGSAWSFDPRYAGVLLMALSSVIIFGGLKRIARFAEMAVPFMAIVYVLVACYVLLANITELPGLLAEIFREAFGLREAAGGALGHTFATAARNGIKRGLFSNEAGMGSSPNATSIANPKHPVDQSMISMVGVFVDTIIICSATAAVILLSGVYQPGSGVAGVALTQKSLNACVGSWGDDFVAVAMFFFAFTSILGNYVFGEVNVDFLLPNNKVIIAAFRFVFLVMIWFGATRSLKIVWGLGDAFMGMMSVVNILAIAALYTPAKAVLNDYIEQLKHTDEPTFKRENFSWIPGVPKHRDD